MYLGLVVGPSPGDKFPDFMIIFRTFEIKGLSEHLLFRYAASLTSVAYQVVVLHVHGEFHLKELTTTMLHKGRTGQLIATFLDTKCLSVKRATSKYTVEVKLSI